MVCFQMKNTPMPSINRLSTTRCSETILSFSPRLSLSLSLSHTHRLTDKPSEWTRWKALSQVRNQVDESNLQPARPKAKVTQQSSTSFEKSSPSRSRTLDETNQDQEITRQHLKLGSKAWNLHAGSPETTFEQPAEQNNLSARRDEHCA